MKRALSLFLVFVVAGLLSGCLYGANPRDEIITIRAGASQTFSVSIGFFPPPGEVTWELDGEPVEPDPDTKKSKPEYTFYANNDNINDSEDGSEVTPYILTASESGGDTITWEIIVKPSIYTSEIDGSQAEEVLYALYAGIGHMPSTDAFLYGVMLKDLNELTGYLINAVVSDFMNTVLGSLGSVEEIIEFLTKKQTHIVEDNTNTYTATFDPSGLIGTKNFKFSATLSVDFDSTNGLTLNNCKYTGTTGSTDLFCQIEIGLYVNISTFELQKFNLNSIRINPRNTLLASYISSSTVTYDNWIISYGVTGEENPVNAKLLPDGLFAIPGVTADHRDYTLNGSFSVNGNTYELLGGGFNYQHIDNMDGTSNIVISGGEMNVPSIEKRVRIVQTADIIRDNSTGQWTQGELAISGYGPSVEVSFLSSANADFDLYVDETLTDSWTVSNWMDTLEP